MTHRQKELFEMLLKQAGYKEEGKMYVHHTVKSAFPIEEVFPKEPSPAINEGEKERVFTLADMKKAWLSGFGTASLKGSSEFMKDWFKKRYNLTIKD